MRVRVVRAVASSLLLLAIAVRAGALDSRRPMPDVAHDAWGLAEGLPQLSITSILQTRDGYLWLGTLDGLVRFDGVRFETINLIHAAGMEGNVVLALAESPDGSVWVGTRSGLARYRAGRFTVLGVTEGLTDPTVRCLAIDPKGHVLVGTRAGGLHRFDGTRFTATTTGDGLAANDVRDVTVAPDGVVWVATSGGVQRMGASGMARVRLPDAPASTAALSLWIDATGAVLIGTTDGLWRVPPGEYDAQAGPRLVGREVRDVLTDREGSVWAGTTAGLARLRDDVVEFAESPPLLTQRHVRTLLEDREGSLWIGTDGGGLNRFRDAAVVMLRPPVPPERLALTSILQDASGAVWMTGNCSGLIQYTPEATRVWTTADGLPDDCGRTLAVAPDGTVWIGTSRGLARLAGNRVTAYTAADGLSGNDVRALAVDRSGALWIGVVGGGLDRFAGGAFTHLGVGDGLAGDDVRVLLESRDGALWVGTFTGLSRVEGSRVTTYTRRDGLSNNAVLALHEDEDGTLWIGTNGGGLTRLRGGAFTRYATADGLFSDSIFQLIDPGDGYLWMGSIRGIFRVLRRDLEERGAGTRQTVTSEHFDARDGLVSTGVMGGYQPSGFRDAAGRLWFPTSDGVAILDPAGLRRNEVAPLVDIQRVRAGGETYAVHPVPRLPAGTRDVEIDYTALSFLAPAHVTFVYRLSGQSTEWFDAGPRRTAYFTRLPPGTYRFEVRARNADGVVSETPAVIAFELLPYVYQTRAFLGGAAAALLLVVWGAYRLRIRQLRVRAVELKQQVDRALADIKVLEGLLPICASCKRIRDTHGTWTVLESYIRDHSRAEFSHGICPECATALYDEDLSTTRPRR